MTLKQRIIKFFYPWLMRMSKVNKKKTANPRGMAASIPPVSFHSLFMKANDGKEIPFSSFRGKKVLLVNTASACGYTPQYAELQELSDRYRDRLVVLGFPCNDFGEQEKGSNDEIAAFCQVNYGISFPLAEKSSVLQGPGQNGIFAWLTRKTENGWNDQVPKWNFTKFLVDEMGALLAVFEPGISPLSGEVLAMIDSAFA